MTLTLKFAASNSVGYWVGLEKKIASITLRTLLVTVTRYVIVRYRSLFPALSSIFVLLVLDNLFKSFIFLDRQKKTKKKAL